MYKNINRRIKLIFNKPTRLVTKLLQRYPFLCSDSFFIKLFYRERMGIHLNIKEPKTYNEKLNWLKLHYREPIMTTLVDKYEVKKYVSEKIGKQYIIPTYGVWDSFDEINFDKLPNQFVLKTTHDGGGVVICHNKNEFDISSAKNKLNKHLKKNHFNHAREWPYKNVKPRIIAEELLIDTALNELRDYKFFCFNGEPKLMSLYLNRQSNEPTRRSFFNMDFEPYEFYQVGIPYLIEEKLPKPQEFDKMIELAAILSGGFPHVRVDFYNVNGQIFFGELTFYHASGTSRFIPNEWDRKIGDWLVLPN